VRRLQTLFDNVPPRPFAEVRRSMERELRLTLLASSDVATAELRLEDVFLSLDEAPLAAASIAQVRGAQNCNPDLSSPCYSSSWCFPPNPEALSPVPSPFVRFLQSSPTPAGLQILWSPLAH